MATTQKELLSRREAAEIFGVTEQTISNYIKYGIIKCVKHDKFILVTRQSISRVLDDMRSDDELSAKTQELKRLTQQHNERARKEYDIARNNASILHMLNNNNMRDILLFVVKSMGYRHLPDNLEDSICIFISDWNRHKINDMLGMTYDGVRDRMIRALRALRSLPSYSELEDKIEIAKNDNKLLSLQCSRLQKMKDSLEDELSKYRNIEATGKPYNDEDLNMYEMLQTKIDDMDFSVRVKNYLRGNSVETIGDLVQHKKTDILRFRNLGKKSLHEIEDKLNSLSLSFGMDISRYNNAYFNKIQRKYAEERKGGEQ